MLDVRANSIIYQAQVYYTNLVNSLVATKSLGKQRLDDWRKADLILGYLQTWAYENRLQTDGDTTNYNYILYALIQLCGINSYPVGSPLTAQAAPILQAGPPGQSITGPQGPQGLTGLATDFSIISSSTTVVVDSFPIASAHAARWDYFIVSGGGAQRASSVVGHWTSSLVELADDGADDLIGDTSGCEFTLNISGSTIQLIATITSGTWSIFGSRYLIPNNGSGSGPITNVLPLGQIYIGNASNQATAQSMSGNITIGTTGITTIAVGAIVNSMINTSAAIALTKLAALSNSQMVVTNSSGVLISLATPSLTTLGFLDATSSIQTQLDSKLTDPTTNIGDIIIRNVSNVIARVPIGSDGQVLVASGGVPIWQNAPGGVSGLTTGFLPIASSATSLTNSIISETTGAILVAGTIEIQNGYRTQASGAYLKTVILPIGTWSLTGSPSSAAIVHGLTQSKIRGINVVLIDDSATTYLTLPVINTSGVTLVWTYTIGPTAIGLWASTPTLPSGSWTGSSSNRGYVTITYEA